VASNPPGGVQRVFDAPPDALNTADLPAMWPQLPSADDAALTFAGGYWPTWRVEVVVALDAVGQSTQAQIFSSAVDMLDTWMTTLETIDAAASRLALSMRVSVVEVAGTAFWAVVCDIEAEG